MAKANTQTHVPDTFGCILLADSPPASGESHSSCLVSPSLTVTCCCGPLSSALEWLVEGLR